jgi:hypothetical protein
VSAPLLHNSRNAARAGRFMTTLLLLDLPRVRQWTLNARSIMPLCLDGERHGDDTGQRGQPETAAIHYSIT